MKPENDTPAMMTTEIAFILDRSGSMESVRDAAIAGFNEFLRAQQAAPGMTRLTLVLFDDWIECPFRSIPVSEVVALDRDTFVPRGSTSLLDAVGETIDDLGARLAKLPEKARPEQVIVAVLTDGEENSSGRFTWKDVSARIAHQTRKYQWEFLFLGAGPDAIATAAKLKIGSNHAAQYCADAVGQQAAMASIARKIENSRILKSGKGTREQLEEAERPLDDILREEDGKRRGE